MTIKIFVDWRNEQVFTEEEYNKRVEKIAEKLRTDDDDFSDFLEKNYSHRVLWEADEEQRAQIMERWAYECLDEAYEELGYEEIEIDI